MGASQIVDDATQTTATYSEEYTFDGRARVTGVTNNLGASTYAFVGQSGRPSTVSYPNGMQVLYDYFGATGDFLLKQIKNMSAGPSPTVISQFDYTYRQDRSIDTWTIDQGSGPTTWSFGYDGSRELTSAKRNDNDGGALLESNAYGYDKAGNRIQVGNGTTAPKNYDTNNLNQLLSERDNGRTTFAGYVDEPSTVKVNGQTAKVTSTDGGAPFHFEGIVDLDAGANTIVVEAKDGNNNTATKTYSVTTTGQQKKFEYDLNGNLRYEKQPNGTVIREYRWDQQNRLVRAIIGTHESVYSYDGESRRVRIQELESSVQTKDETLVWCGGQICQKRASNGTTVTRTYFGGGFKEGSDAYEYTRDHLGSVREVVASDGSTIASRLRYDPWGKIMESGSAAATDIGFTGHYYDRSTGLGLTHYRGYDPLLARWLTEDPSGLVGGMNLYAYVDDRPTNYSDPSGLGPLDFIHCLLALNTIGTCWDNEKDASSHGPAGDKTNGDGFGGLIVPPAPPIPGGPGGAANGNGGGGGGPGVGGAAGGGTKGPGGGERDHGICELKRQFTFADCDGKQKNYCQYFCPQSGATLLKQWPTCPDPVAFGNAK